MKKAVVWHSRRRRPRKGRTLQPGVFCLSGRYEIPCTPHTEQQMRALLALPPSKRKIEGLETQQVPLGDLMHPSSLWQQKGVQYTGAESLETGTVLGVYEGKEGPSSSCTATEYSCEYTALDGTEMTIEPMKGGLGNRCMEFINDYRFDIVDLASTLNRKERLNCDWLFVRVDSAVYAFILATAKLKRGDWLFIDYGWQYWMSRPTCKQHHEDGYCSECARVEEYRQGKEKRLLLIQERTRRSCPKYRSLCLQRRAKFNQR